MRSLGFFAIPLHLTTKQMYGIMTCTLLIIVYRSIISRTLKLNIFTNRITDFISVCLVLIPQDLVSSLICQLKIYPVDNPIQDVNKS
jgi:hypothetical protein